MRLSIHILLTGALALAGCRSQAANLTLPASVQPAAEELPATYPDLGEAPELGNEIWINTSEPLRLADLRGKVVLIDMWTFG